MKEDQHGDKQRLCRSCDASWSAPVDACPMCGLAGWMLAASNTILDESYEPRNRLQSALSYIRAAALSHVATPDDPFSGKRTRVEKLTDSCDGLSWDQAGPKYQVLAEQLERELATLRQNYEYQKQLAESLGGVSAAARSSTRRRTLAVDALEQHMAGNRQAATFAVVSLDFAHAQAEAIDHLHEELDAALSATRRSEWVSVKDRLPEGDKRYLVTDGTLYRTAWFSAPAGCKPWWDCHGQQIIVTHWTELPTLPSATTDGKAD